MVSFVRNCFYGEERLWKPYWLGVGLGMFVYVGVFVAAFVLIMLMVGEDHSEAALEAAELAMLPYALLLEAILLPFHGWWWVSVWRCAPNSSHMAWMILARVVVVLSIVGYVLDLGNSVLMLAGQT